MNLSDMANFTNVELKLKPDFNHLESHLFGKEKNRHTQVVFS